MARKKEKISNPLLDYLDLSIKKQKGGGVKVAFKKEKPLTVHDCFKEHWRQAKILKKKYKKLGWKIKIRRKKR